jgi:hypothetical protein
MTLVPDLVNSKEIPFKFFFKTLFLTVEKSLKSLTITVPDAVGCLTGGGGAGVRLHLPVHVAQNSRS